MKKEYYPLTPAQERMFVLKNLNKESTAYNSPIVKRIKGTLDIDRLEKAFLGFTRRHESLRTGFKLINGEPVQTLHRIEAFKLTYWQDIEEEQVQRIITQFIQPFNLEEPPLLRAGIIRLSPKEFILVVDLHHIISDLKSEDILVRDLFELYHDNSLPVLEKHYKEYAQWCKNTLSREHLKEEEKYWLDKFTGELPILDMLTDRSRPPVFSFKGSISHYKIADTMIQELNAFVRQNNVSLYNLFLTAFFIFLCRYTGQEDIIIGTPQEVRPGKAFENIIGLFINTLPIRVYPQSHKTVRQLLYEVTENTKSALDNFNFDIGYLVDKPGTTRNPARNPLFDTLFFYNKRDTERIGGLEISPFEFIHEKAEFDLTIGLLEIDTHLYFSIEYYRDIFEPQTIERMALHYQNILREMISYPGITLSKLKMLSGEEDHQIIFDFNNTTTDYPSHKTIRELFPEQVNKAPDKTALVFEDTALSYRELDERSNHAASLLNSNELIGIMVQRSLELIIGILGILKTGSAYVPIDVSYPRHRIDYIIQDSAIGTLLTISKLHKRTNFKGTFIDLDIVLEPRAKADNTDHANDLAYIMYTSGSTGVPKGVMVTHRNVVRLVKNTSYIEFSEGNRILQTGAPAFDATTFEIWGSLLNGGTLYLITEEKLLNAALLEKELKDNKITILFFTSLLFNQLVEQNADIFSGLYFLLVGGEVISPKHINTVKKQNKKLKIINVYGPTENTTFSTSFLIEKEYQEKIPIGKPIHNSTVYILSGANKLQPVGVRGELCVGGDGVSRGYLNNPGLTAKKFIQNPFKKGDIIYKSGDFGRWLPDGTIDFLGRMDSQVKIRGYRVEIGEIENVLKTHPAIKDTIVLVKHLAGEKILTAYVVIKDKSLGIETMRNYLKEFLPHYMVPARFVLIDSIPMTPGGKVDKAALPEPESAGAVTGEYRPPSTDTEHRLVKLWQDLLKIKKVGITDNFFDLGGHSLKATTLTVTIQKEFNRDFPLSEIFKHPVIRDIARYLDRRKHKHTTPYAEVPHVEKQHYYPLTPSERMIYLLQLKDNRAYNSVFPMIIEDHIDKDKLTNAVKTVIERHEVFRTGYEFINGKPAKVIYDTVDFHLVYRESIGQEIESLVDTMKQPYDLGKPPLLRVLLGKFQAGKYLCVVANNHIISDGVTEAVLMKEISDAYQGKELKKIRLQYKDFTMWQNQLLASGHFKRQKEYWVNNYKDNIPVLELPLDYPRPSQFVFEGRTTGFKADCVLTQHLHRLSRQADATLFMVLLAAYTTLLYRYTSQEDIIVGFPISNRQHAELQDITGILLNMIPVKNFPKPDKRFDDFLKEVRLSVLAAYENQDYPFEALLETLNVKRYPGRNPLFNTILVLQNTEPAILKIDGIKVVPYTYHDKTAKFDISVEAREINDEIQFNVEYCTKLFREDTIQRFCTHFSRLLSEIAHYPHKSLGEIGLLSEPEKKKLSDDLNRNAASAYPFDKTISHLFEEQVGKTPGKVAVVYKTGSLTYQELNQRANFLAGLLRDKGVKPGNIIGLLVERSLDMIVCILGIVKAGGAYLPIDPGFPEERITYMLKDSNVGVLVTTPKHQVKVKAEVEENFRKSPQLPLQFINPGTRLESAIAPSLSTLTSTSTWQVSPVNLAYIIYTSGTTGKPKGVMIEHRHVVRLLFNDLFQFDFTYEDTWTLFHSICFDFSVWEMYGALLRGGRLIVVPRQMTHDLRAYAALLRKEQVTVLNQTPSVFMHLMEEELSYPHRELYLRVVILGGEALQPGTLQAWQNRYTDCQLINGYGITETTVFVTFKEITGHEITRSISNIGKPMPTLSTYVMDNMLHLVPIGVPGELCVGGAGVGQGYINRPELTAEKFVINPYKPGERIYRSGDLVKMLTNGEMVYLGRLDRQIKIRGFRIELGEIESCLSRHNAVNQCAVTLYESSSSGEKYITAYYAAKHEIIREELRTYLLEMLPAHMIPGFFLEIAQFPLTVNGKIDYNALPVPGMDSLQPKNHAAPRNETEKMLVNVWQNILNVEDIGVFDNFFEIGGHSLKAYRIAHTLHKNGFNVSSNDIFTRPTIAGLAELIDNMKNFHSPITMDSTSTGPQGLRQQYPDQGFPLSPVQRRFFRRSLHNFNIFNIPFLAQLKNAVTPGIIVRVIKHLLNTHKSLSLHFQKDKTSNTWYQFYREEPPGRYFIKVDLSEIPQKRHNSFISEYCAQVQYQFNLLSGPLFKVVLFDNYDLNKRQVLFFVFHHLCFDGESQAIFLEDFKRCCLKMMHSQTVEGLKSTSSYKEWCVKLEAYAANSDFKDQNQYWLNLLVGGQSFPVDAMPGKGARHRDMTHYKTRLLYGKEEIDKTSHATKKYQCSLLPLLLAGLYSACRDCKKHHDLLLHIMSNQRESFFPGISIHNTIGFFAGAYPVRFCLKEPGGNDCDYQETIDFIKTSLYTVPRGGLDYFVLKYLLPEIKNTQSGLIDPAHMLFHFSDQRHTIYEREDNFYLPLQLPVGSTNAPDNPSAYLLNMTALLDKNSLNLTCYYSRLHYRKPTILKLSRLFAFHFRRIIDIDTI